MYLVKARYDFMTEIDQDSVMQFIESIGRVCYKSENRIGPGTAENFCKMILGSGHESVIEHYSFTVKFTIDRGVSHELVRHRLAAYSQESTRYCNYAKKGIVFVIPPWLDLPEGECQVLGDKILCNDTWMTVQRDTYDWLLALQQAEGFYGRLLNQGWRPEQARSVLPNALKTEIVSTYNLREWRHIFKLRTMGKAHPQMREVMIPLLAELKVKLPIFFGDI